jgi:hypothetical protein
MATEAPCCRKAINDATARWPRRNRASDGIMGDAAHQKRKSDHNDGNAFDLTHDPAHGVDCNDLSRRALFDPRVTQVIWNRQTCFRHLASAGWQPYKGSNPHVSHMHVSIRATMRNDLSIWPWTLLPYPGRPLQIGMHGTDVRTVQHRLLVRSKNITVDGIFGPETRQVVMAFQQQNGLTPDGIVGPLTYAAL